MLLMLLVPGARAGEKKGTPAGAALEQLKQLAGTWVQADEQGRPTDKVVSVFKVTAGGSAVHETIFPGSPHEMVTLYHKDGPDLVLTHYCAAGNQPRMKRDPKDPAGTLRFEFAGGSNLDHAKDAHMHEGSITVVDKDRIVWNWVGYQGGKADEGHKVGMKLVRKK
jgi:hypothetical protein